MFAIIACLVAAAASLLRGETYHYSAPASDQAPGDGAPLDAAEASVGASADREPIVRRIAEHS